MKNFIAILTSLLLVGCVVSPAPIEYKFIANDDETSISDFRWYPDNDGPGYHCDPFVYQVTIDDHLYLVSVPSSCDPRTYIYKGDPGPDMGKELENLDPIFQEKIVKMVIVSNNLNYQ